MRIPTLTRDGGVGERGRAVLAGVEGVAEAPGLQDALGVLEAVEEVNGAGGVTGDDGGAVGGRRC